jgi:hypothetical protein
MMKKIIIMIMIGMIGMSSYARPHFHHGHHHHHGRAWVVPAAIVGGLVAGNIIHNITQPRVVYVNSPVVQPVTPSVVPVAPAVNITPANIVTIQYQKVWVPGQYVTKTLPNGRLENVWIPGHYELRQIQ